MSNQQTLADSFKVSGVGLHEGVVATVVVRPAEPNTGFVFVRTDIPEQTRIPYSTEHLGPQERRTQIVSADAEVHTCEHLVAGLFGTGIDNALIEIDGPEPPACDGSAGAFVEKVVEVGHVEQQAERHVFMCTETIVVEDGNASVRLEPCTDAFEVDYTLDYGTNLPQSRVTQRVDESSFVNSFARARTFCLEEEAKMLQAMGFGKGATTDNTLVISKHGPIENTLRWPDEYARHKVLDLVGDLALAGCRIEGRITAVRSGHKMNQQLARQIVEKLGRKV